MKKTFSIKNHFKEALRHINESKHYIFISIFLLIFGSVIGFLFQDYLASMINSILQELLKKTSGLNTFQMILFIFQNNLTSAFASLFGGIFLGISPIVSGFTNGVILGYVMSVASETSGFASWWRILPHGIFELPAIFISFGLGMSWGIRTMKNYFDVYRKNKKMSSYGILTILITMLGIAFSLILYSQFGTGLSNIPVLMSATFATAVVLAGMIIFIALFIFNPEKKIRQFQKNYFYNSLNVFIFVIIPLLIIAAIIEGLLIRFLP